MAANVPTKQDLIDGVIVVAAATGWAVIHRSTQESKQRWPGEPGVIVAKGGEVVVFWPHVHKRSLNENERATREQMPQVDGVIEHVEFDHTEVIEKVVEVLA